MNLNKLSNAIHRGKWLIEPNLARGERQRAIKFLGRDFSTASDEDFEKLEVEKPKAFKAGSFFDIDDDHGFELAQAGSVAIIPICGTIMKYDYCGTPGTDTLGSWLKSAIASPQIDSIVLLVNSGGGSVEGTGEFADLVKASTKTVLTFCDGMIASAAYWIGSAAEEIWVSHSTVEAGSIGVAACFFDDSKALEEAGYQDIYINADSSPDKNMDYFEAIQGNTARMRANSLNPLDKIFMGTVKANRPSLKLTDVKIGDETYQEPLTGKVYLAEQAIENGLIDGICTLEQCIERSLEIKNTPKKNTTMAVTADEKDKAVKKSSTLLAKIQALFTSEEMDDEEAKKADDEEDAKKADDEDETKKQDAKKVGKKSDDNDDDSDDDNDDDSDEDEIEVNGTKINVKDASAVKAAFAAITENANKAIADRDALLVEAETALAENNTLLAKSTEEVKKEIKSTFTIKGSQRSNKIGVTGEEDNSQAFKPAAGSYADNVLKRALAKQKAAIKQVK